MSRKALGNALAAAAYSDAVAATRSGASVSERRDEEVRQTPVCDYCPFLFSAAHLVHALDTALPGSSSFFEW